MSEYTPDSTFTDASGMTPRIPGEAALCTPRDLGGGGDLNVNENEHSNPWNNRHRLPGIVEQSECGMSDLHGLDPHASSSASGAVSRVLLDRQAKLPPIHAAGMIRGAKLQKSQTKGEVQRALQAAQAAAREKGTGGQTKCMEGTEAEAQDNTKENNSTEDKQSDLLTIDDYSALHRNNLSWLMKQKQLADTRIRPVNENILKALHHEKVYFGKFKRSATTLNGIHEKPETVTLSHETSNLQSADKYDKNLVQSSNDSQKELRKKSPNAASVNHSTSSVKTSNMSDSLQRGQIRPATHAATGSRSKSLSPSKMQPLFRSKTSQNLIQKRISSHLQKKARLRYDTRLQTNLAEVASSEASPRPEEHGGGESGRHLGKRTPRMMRSRPRKQSMMPTARSVTGGLREGDEIIHVKHMMMPGTRIRWALPGEACEFFRVSARKVSIVLKWWHLLLGEGKKVEGELMSFLDIARNLEKSTLRDQIQQQSGVVFDPSEFKKTKDREIKLAADVKSFLTLPKEARDHGQLQKVLHGLEVVKSFSEYPLHMQEKLAKVAWYQEYPPKKIILKQGHYAENFYFILSGVALVKIIMTNKSTGLPSMNVVARLAGGQSFGEVALLHHSKRTATIESDSTTCMLVISRQDFFDIFFNAKNGKEPEYITFCREVDFLQHWPIEILLTTPGMCMFHYFKRGSTVIGDSTKNDWIYIVKSGTCSVVKRLRAVDAERVWDQKQTPSERLRLPVMELPTTEIGARTDSNFGPRSLPRESPSLLKVMEEFWTAGDKQETESMDIDNDLEMEDHKEKPGKMKRKTSVTFQVPCDRNSVKRSMSAEGEENGGGKARSVNGETIQEHKPPRSKVNNYLRQTTQSPSTKPNSKGPVSTKPTQPLSQPCFVLLKSLKPKDAFGLEDVHFADEEEPSPAAHTSVSLVSNGAELIMLSRKFFTQHSAEKTKQFIREHVWPFPTEDTMQANLQDEVNWTLFRKEMITNTLQRQELERSIVIT